MVSFLPLVYIHSIAAPVLFKFHDGKEIFTFIADEFNPHPDALFVGHKKEKAWTQLAVSSQVCNYCVNFVV